MRSTKSLSHKYYLGHTQVWSNSIQRELGIRKISSICCALELDSRMGICIQVKGSSSRAMFSRYPKKHRANEPLFNDSADVKMTIQTNNSVSTYSCSEITADRMRLFDSCGDNILGTRPMAQPNNSSLDLTVPGSIQVGASQAGSATTVQATSTNSSTQVRLPLPPLKLPLSLPPLRLCLPLLLQLKLALQS
jgi:hypothetical protein